MNTEMRENVTWLDELEKTLNDAAEVLEQQAEEPWQAQVHKHVVEAWRLLKDQRESRFHGGS